MKLATRTHIRSVPVLDPIEDEETCSMAPPTPDWVESDVPDWQWQEFMAERHEQESLTWR